MTAPTLTHPEAAQITESMTSLDIALHILSRNEIPDAEVCARLGVADVNELITLALEIDAR